MSRNIVQLHTSYQKNPLKQTDSGKLIFTSYKDYELALLFRQNRLLAVHTLDNTSKIGTIYIGKVKNVVKNLNACFVEIANGELCFLPFHEAEAPLMLNRPFDGRLLQGDELLVQVQKDALKTKQAALTCHISLQNECFVFSMGNKKAGISSKLTKEQKADIASFLLNNNITNETGMVRQISDIPSYGCVIRTEAGKVFADNPDIFLQEFTAMETEYIRLLQNAKHRTCFSCIKAPQKPYQAILGEFRTNEYEEVITDLPEAYTSLQGHVTNLRLYEDDTFPLYKLYALETKLQAALNKNVWLKSGAYLVIEQTECLTTIDVNSGKMLKGTQKEEAIWQINEEAAKEAALQIRLRNLSGIIIIDFINMKDKTAEAKLLNLMKEWTATDMVTTTVIDMTPLGLMELTRKKVKRSLTEQLAPIF